MKTFSSLLLYLKFDLFCNQLPMLTKQADSLKESTPFAQINLSSTAKLPSNILSRASIA